MIDPVFVPIALVAFQLFFPECKGLHTPPLGAEKTRRATCDEIARLIDKNL